MEAKQQIILPPPPTAPNLLCADAKESKLYWDRSHYDSPESQMRALTNSATLYVGNLAFSTRVCHLKGFFSTIGPVKAINMGLDRNLKTPCGFAFVEYMSREHALSAVAYLSGTKLDEKVIRVELDAGFKPGRQYGRGKKGGQVRDDRRGSFDPKRRAVAPTNTMSSRWQAPIRSAAETNDEGLGGHYGPAASSSGAKRGRDESDDDNAGERPQKNSRFDDDEL
jgi:nuclear cap-binding protein subunit 2